MSKKKSLSASSLSLSLPSPGDPSVEEIPLPLILRQSSYADIKTDLLHSMRRSSRLCLLQSQKWAAEMLRPLHKIKLRPGVLAGIKSPVEGEQGEAKFCAKHSAYPAILNAMRRFQYGEAMGYARMRRSEFRHFPVLRFFYFFNKYLHGQAQCLQNAPHPLEFESVAETDVLYLQNLRGEIKEELVQQGLDPLMRYLYAVILRQLGSHSLACEQLIEAISHEPRLWCFWFELADCILTRRDLELILPRLRPHWMRDVFLGRCYYLLNMTEEALGVCKYLRRSLLANTPPVLAQLARVAYNRKDTLDTVKLMDKLRHLYPARLDDMDFYSNVLYVRGDKTRLARLARDLHEIDRLAPETNVAVGNYLGLRDQHDRAVEHLTLAIRAVPDLAQAWLFLGHEYLELKNQPRAVACLQRAVQVDPRDYRAWFGLGKVHESDKKYSLAILYFQRSADNAFHDPKPWCALGDVFVKLNQPEDAARAYWQSYQNGDKEDGAMGKLGRVLIKSDAAKAAIAFQRYIAACEEVVVKGKEDVNRSVFAAELGEAYLFLARQQLEAGNTAEARAWARKALGISGMAKAVSEFLLRVDGKTEHERSVNSDASAMDLNVTDNSAGVGMEGLISDDEENLPSTIAS
ncbi:cell division cycle protein 23 homolog isoform X2 [Paramacrobiotus metropolitanus]|uniref:cell division cycle protein 23 homolog isoform X2 n=1 Tax=Paramacrobiotus metropolitanus TaxID=2943436 RepID=UPI002445C07B|nr:cell division cycle protein 23 homolog isoform X2 [Paramacrobiotus metropolitanus]